MAYPFGYGLSYTGFEWSGFTGSYDEADDEFTFNVTVKNTGDAAGKEVVQLYMQSPYTAYDIENKVEKAARSARWLCQDRRTCKGRRTDR